MACLVNAHSNTRAVEVCAFCTPLPRSQLAGKHALSKQAGLLRVVNVEVTIKYYCYDEASHVRNSIRRRNSGVHQTKKKCGSMTRPMVEVYTQKHCK